MNGPLCRTTQYVDLWDRRCLKFKDVWTSEPLFFDTVVKPAMTFSVVWNCSVECVGCGKDIRSRTPHFVINQHEHVCRSCRRELLRPPPKTVSEAVVGLTSTNEFYAGQCVEFLKGGDHDPVQEPEDL